jgi:hypothetical protein
LRRQYQFQFARQHLALELLVLTHVAGDDFLHLPRLQQKPHAEIIDAGVVADDGQVLGAAVDQCLDEIFRDAAEAESACGNGHAVLQQALQCSGCIGVDFFHRSVDSVGLCGQRTRGAVQFTR